LAYNILHTILLLIAGAAGWYLKSRYEELRAIEERLASERRKIYADLIDPFVQLFSAKDDQERGKIVAKLTEYDYRKTSFEYVLMGSDGAIRAYNNLMAAMYTGNKDPETRDEKEILRLLCSLLLEIRKSLGEKKSKLKNKDMLRWMINDIDSFL
jgi:hypothetical protein